MQKKPFIFVSQPIPENGLQALAEVGRTEIWPHKKLIPRAELLRRIEGADAVVTMVTDQVDAEFFKAAGPQLKIVANYAVGFDNINLKEAAARKVAVTNTPGAFAEAVAEHTLALLFAVARRVVEGDRFVRNGEYEGWIPMAFLGQPLWGKTLGIIGLGRIGAWVAEAAHRGFNMPILYADERHNEDVEMRLGARRRRLDVVLRESDIVSLHVPLGPTTRHLIGERELKLMKPSAILINTARGAVVDEQALYHALKSEEIFGAGLDVYEHEPKLYRGLEKLPNVVLTPHSASATLEARSAMAEIMASNVRAVLAGRPPLNPVDPVA